MDHPLTLTNIPHSDVAILDRTNTSFFHLEDVQKLFYTHPPITAQTEHSSDFKFGMRGPQGKLSGMTEAIFAISPLSSDIGMGCSTLRSGKKSGNFFFQISIFLIDSTFFRSAIAKKVPICLILRFFGCFLMFQSAFVFFAKNFETS